MTTLVVSDLHLDPSAPEIAAQFAGFLAGEARGAAALYVLGDLFEVWLGDDDPRPEHREVIAKLRALAHSGVSLFFMHGNRDFLLGAGFARDTGGTILTDPTLALVEGRRVLFTHGDALCTGDTPYQKLRAMVREPLWQAQFLALSLAQREAVAAEARAGSKAHVAVQKKMLMDVSEGAVVDALRRSGAELLIHGHTHRPGVHSLTVDGRACTRIVLGDWYSQGSLIELAAGDYRLRTLAR
jgi:UDP-2,3-diacylglucosamine hydrolase